MYMQTKVDIVVRKADPDVDFVRNAIELEALPDTIVDYERRIAKQDAAIRIKAKNKLRESGEESQRLLNPS